MLLATLVLLAVPALAAGPIHIPLTRHTKRALVQQAIGGVNTDVGSGFSFPIQLGTPPQDLSVFLGMGSGNGLTMFGCNGCGDDTPFYRPNRSSTWNKTASVGGPFNAAFEDSNVLGQKLPGAPCAYGNSTDATKQYSPATGQGGQFSLGLGLKANDKIGPAVPALSKGWDEPTFGVHIGGGDKGGQLSFGGLDNTLFTGEVKYVPTLNSKTWNFAVDGVKVGEQEIDVLEYLQGQQAAMAQASGGAGGGGAGDPQRRLVVRPEVGSDMFQCTPGVADRMFGPIPGANRTATVQGDAKEDAVRASTGLPSTSGYSYTVPCNTNATISFTVNGTDYRIPPEKWVVKDPTGKATDCNTRVMVGTNDTFGDELYDVLVGTLFLDSVYSAYKYDAAQPQIGFAQLSDKAMTMASGAATSAAASSATGTTSGAERTTAGTGAGVFALVAAAVAAVL